MKSKIILRQINNYTLDAVETFVRDALRQFGGFTAGQSVLLKPNLLKAARPERCVTTHPVVLEAVCRALKDYGVGRIDIGDSPAMGSLAHVAHTAGYAPLVKRYGVSIVPFSKPVPLEIEENIPHLKIAGNISEYDRIINLPKFKSHQQMTLTLGIKNLFGCVIGKRKPVLHCLVKNDKVKFGRMLVDIAKHVKPCLTIVDGIEAMQGSGPVNGTPYPLRLMACGQDMTALDRILVEIVQVPLERVYVLEAARQRNFGSHEMKNIDMDTGAHDIKQLLAPDFKLADMNLDISFNPFRVMKSFIKQFYEVGIKEKIAG
jgi:uncharacterized protein (DUF362 family)